MRFALNFQFFSCSRGSREVPDPDLETFLLKMRDRQPDNGNKCQRRAPGMAISPGNRYASGHWSLVALPGARLGWESEPAGTRPNPGRRGLAPGTKDSGLMTIEGLRVGIGHDTH